MSKSTDTPSDKPKKKTATASKNRKSSKSEDTLLEVTQTDAMPLETNHTPQAIVQEEDDGSEGGSGQAVEKEPVEQIDSEYSSLTGHAEFEDMDDLNQDPRDIFQMESDEELLNRITGVYQIWWNWAHFELSIVSPLVSPLEPCEMIHPEQLSSADELEFVYPICDYGNKLVTSKGAEMYSVGMSMCKLYYTIEKMIFILIERLKSDGVSTETEIQIAFDGHQLAQRKAFESVINLSYNVVVTNFDPGAWGERYLEIVKRLADKGYGYPPEAPRDSYRSVVRASMSVKR